MDELFTKLREYTHGQRKREARAAGGICRRFLPVYGRGTLTGQSLPDDADSRARGQRDESEVQALFPDIDFLRSWIGSRGCRRACSIEALLEVLKIATEHKL